MEAQQIKSKRKPFETKHLFLTYPQSEGLEKLGVLQQLCEILLKEDRALEKYIVAQEFHQDLGIHFHVYMQLDKPIKKRNVRLFDLKIEGKPDRHPNIQSCRQPLQVRRYCIKDGDYITNLIDKELEEKITQRDVQRIIGERAIAGEPLCTIIKDYPEQLVNYHRLVQSVNLYRLHSLKPMQTKGTRGVWIWGKSGVGKSHFVRQYCREQELGLFIKPAEKWWDGYGGEPAVLLDDYDKRDNQSGHELKIWADKYAITAEVKNGTVPLMYKVLFITAQYPIEVLFEDVRRNDVIVQDRSELRAAISRRFQVIEMTSRHNEMDFDMPEVEMPEDSEEMDL